MTSIQCPNGDICNENTGFQTDCLIYYGPSCDVPCDLSKCVTEIIQNQDDCIVWSCQPATTTTMAPPGTPGIEVVEIVVPIIMCLGIAIGIYLLWKRRPMPDIGHSVLG